MKKQYNFWMFNHYAGNLQQGMEYRHFFLARHLRRMGHQVSIIASTYSHLYSSPPKVDKLITFKSIDGVNFVWLRGPYYYGNGFKRLLNMLSYSLLAEFSDLTKNLGTPDVVLGSSPHPFTIWNTLRIGRRYKIPTLIEIRDLWPLMLIELGSMTSNHPLSRVFQWLENKGFREADRIISLWHSADDYMLRHGVDRRRYRYLPNGIELDDQIFSGNHPLLDAVDLAKSQDKFVIGYGGSHGHANPLNQVIDSCVELRERGIKDVLFFMVGDGPDKKEAVRKSQELNLENLHWFDSVPKDVVMAFYRRLDSTFIGLRDLPLFKYGPTPNKLMDYLAVGRPIIYAIRSSFDPVAENDLGLSISPDDGRALADAIIEMKSSSAELRAEMGKRARAFAEKEHSYLALANKLDAIIQELL